MTRTLRVMVGTALTWFVPGGLHAQEALPVCPWPGPAQFLLDRPSPPDSVLFGIGSGAVKVCYSRPSARGRVVFGEVVRFGRLWRTGANEPTLLSLSFAAEVAGVPLEAGTYLLLTIPQPEDWTVILGTSQAPTPAQMFGDMVEVGRGAVRPEPMDIQVETFSMHGVGGPTEGELVLEWERVRVRIPIRVRAEPVR